MYLIQPTVLSLSSYYAFMKNTILNLLGTWADLLSEWGTFFLGLKWLEEKWVKVWCRSVKCILQDVLSIFQCEHHPVISPDETIDCVELDIIIYNLLSICKFYQ